MSIPSRLQKLWIVAGGGSASAGSGWNTTFEAIGLILISPPRNYGHWCTPTNSITFATTGGDGVHYGFVAIDGEITDFSPVVMSVPMGEPSNVVVGANLTEFLALGCRFGYFALEQLVYENERTLRELEEGRFGDRMGANERALLQRLATAFHLSPWQNPAYRLAKLNAVYMPRLQLPQEG